MRVLCAVLSSRECLVPSIAIAHELRRRRHEVHFVTDTSFAGSLAKHGFKRIPRTRHDGPSFSAKHWRHPLHIALQFAHLRYALERFMPDVIPASHLTLGPVAIATARRIPLVFIGPIVYAFPLLGTPTITDFVSARNASWRLNDLRLTYHNACRELDPGLNDEQLLGDRYLLQGVPELDPIIAGRLPAHVRQVGPCLIETPRWDPGDGQAWIREQRARERAVAFIQLERWLCSARSRSERHSAPPKAPAAPLTRSKMSHDNRHEMFAYLFCAPRFPDHANVAGLTSQIFPSFRARPTRAKRRRPRGRRFRRYGSRSNRRTFAMTPLDWELRPPRLARETILDFFFRIAAVDDRQALALGAPFGRL